MIKKNTSLRSKIIELWICRNIFDVEFYRNLFLNRILESEVAMEYVIRCEDLLRKIIFVAKQRPFIEFDSWFMQILQKMI